MTVEPTSGFWFKSSAFEVEPGEDEETNPRMYGRQVAKWLHQEFSALGYDVENVFGEDWGWCVMCQRDPYRLWIGCVNLRDYEYAQPGDPPPPPDHLLWNVVPMAEVPFFRYLHRPKPDTEPGLGKIEAELEQILNSDERVEIVDEEVANTWFAGLGLTSNPQAVKKLPCACCGYRVLKRRGGWEICPICFWEDDPVQIADPWYEGGANKPSLVESQRNYVKLGAMEECFASRVRKPRGDDVRASDWRPVREEDKVHVTTPRDIEKLSDEGRIVAYEYWRRG